MLIASVDQGIPGQAPGGRRRDVTGSL